MGFPEFVAPPGSSIISMTCEPINAFQKNCRALPFWASSPSSHRIRVLRYASSSLIAGNAGRAGGTNVSIVLSPEYGTALF